VEVGYVLIKYLAEFGSKTLYPTALAISQRCEKSIFARGTSPRNMPLLVESTIANVHNESRITCWFIGAAH
jgi:hypothetical protein